MTGGVTEVIESNGDGLNALDSPRALAIDSAGNLYVAGRSSNNVFIVTPGGTITQILDASGDGTHALLAPNCLFIDAADTLFVTGALSNNAFRRAPGGTVTQIIDSTGDGATPLTNPRCIALDDNMGDAYVLSGDSEALFRVTAVPEPSYSTGVLTGIVVLSAMTRHRRRSLAL
ncbi:MAG: SBBP repeat-containing protein [Proteobacteria bacterium]|nr:SBBP repeat-containing protein [Pseudomonadota bacterium]